jgi:hypothetical protein
MIIVFRVAIILSLLVSTSVFAKEPRWATTNAQCTKDRVGDVKIAPSIDGKGKLVAYHCAGIWKPVPLVPSANPSWEEYRNIPKDKAEKLISAATKEGAACHELQAEQIVVCYWR